MNSELMNQEDQEMEIDLMSLFMKIKSLWYVCVIGALVGAIVMVLYTAFLKTPMYSASSQLYLRGTSNSISLQDLQLGSELTKDYEIIFKSRPNMEKVIKKLDLDYTAGTLQSMITIDNPSDTRILRVTVTSADSKEAKDIANCIVEQGMDNIREIDSQEPYLIEKAIENTAPIGSSPLKMTMLGAIAGLIVALGAIFMKFILSDTVRSIDDIEKSIGLPVLAVVVEDKALSYQKKKYMSK